MNALIAYKGALIFGFLIVLLLAGHWLPFAHSVALSPSAPRSHRIAKNLSLAAINGLASVLIVVPITVFSTQWAPSWRPAWWQGGLGFALDVVVLDAWLYAWHRANHVLPLLWRFHEVHHLDETLDASTALRFHFGEVVAASLLRGALVFLMGVPLPSVLAFEALVAMVSLFHHSNLRLPTGLERLLAWVIVTPSIHWVHHHAERSDTDANYATLFSIWDRLFGSRSTSERTAKMQMGVEGARDQSLLALLARPFRS
jgi:sterol desaturase/sphingolipid hydroxylase (fatty acid hydroxylase superfamily)